MAIMVQDLQAGTGVEDAEVMLRKGYSGGSSDAEEMLIGAVCVPSLIRIIA